LSERRILFISGSLGLGHIGRDLAIAEALQRQDRGLTIDWLAASPAAEVVLEAGGRLLPESSRLLDANAIAEGMAEGSRLSLIRYAFGARGEWFRNVEVVDRLTAPGGYDLVIGDETYEIILAYKKDPERKKAPFVMIYDFVGFDPVSWNPLERLGVYLWNRKWSEGMDRAPTFVDLGIFMGEEEDAPDTTFGPFLPNRRAWARARCEFVGYVLPFAPEQFLDRAALRRRLGYDERPVVVCSIGGTAIGRDLLELCGSAVPLAAARLPGMRMVLVCGPRLSPEGLDVPDGVEVRGYVPALRRPFLYSPIEGHSEQEIHVAGRLARHGAGTRMAYSATSAETLADTIVEHVGSEARYPPIPVDGAKVAAARIAELL